MAPQSVKSMAARVAAGDLNPVKLVEETLSKIGKASRYNAYTSVFSDWALQQAETVAAKQKQGKPLGALAGIPVAVKDNILVSGHKTTCASRILQEFVAPYDATAVEKLKQADAVIVGKTNMDEFAMGSSTEYSVFGPARNPRDPERVAGGSSGGSAAAVASETVPLALGSDTGGSIRQPAAFCGVTGMKPTYGRVSRYGLVAFGSSLDQIGPIGQNVEDVALLLGVLAGPDPRDQTCVDRPGEDFTAHLEKDLSGLKVGVAVENFGEGLHEGMKALLQKTLKDLEQQGAALVDIHLPHTEYGVAAYYVLATAEASSNLSRYDGVRYTSRTEVADNLENMYANTRSEGFGWEVKKRILLGTHVLSSGFYDAYYTQAQKVRRKISEDFQKAFADCDVIVAPTTPDLPPELGAFQKNQMAGYLSDIYTVGVNLAGLPGISLPVGSVDGLPVGMQIIGKAFDETGVLQAAAAVERFTRI